MLRDSILTGELRQGEAVTQDGIARQHAVSTMPVREALLMLSHEGVIEARPNRRFRVARMARQDVEDIYWAHGALAARLTAKACERLSDDALMDLEMNTKNLTEASKTDAFDVVESLNWQFHRIINTAADSPKILALMKTTVRQIPRVSMRFFRTGPASLPATTRNLWRPYGNGILTRLAGWQRNMWLAPVLSWSSTSNRRAIGTSELADSFEYDKGRAAGCSSAVAQSNWSSR